MVSSSSVSPVHPAPGEIHSRSRRTQQSGSDQGFHPGAVQVRPLDPLRPVVRPVHLAPSQVQGQTGYLEQSSSDEIFNPGAVQVRPLNLAPRVAGLCPVHPLALHIQGQAPYAIGVSDEVLDPGAVQVRPLNLAGEPVRPVHPPPLQVQGEVCRLLQPGGDEVHDLRAVQVRPLDLRGPPIHPVHLALEDHHRHRVADPLRQGRLGGIAAVRGDVVEVREVDAAVAVHIAQGDVAVVRNGDRGIEDVQPHQHGVDDVDPPVGVDVAENPVPVPPRPLRLSIRRPALPSTTISTGPGPARKSGST